MALEAAISDEIEQRLGRYVAAGAATLATHRYAPELPCDFEVIPTAPGAAAVFISVSDKELTVGVGNGVVDFLTDEHDQWRRDLGELLDAVAEGHYEETITEGRIFERTIDMRFPGTRILEVRYRNLTYDGDDPEDMAPVPGERRYCAWQAADPAE
jgi:hypothetical protein